MQQVANYISCFAEEEGGQEQYKSDKYGVMWYKRTNSIGIRRKFGACNQAFSFGGMRCELDEQQQRGFAEMCLKKLDGGQSEEAVKSWVDEAVSS